MRNNKKTLAIGLLCLALVFMGIGYSLFSTTLNITGTSTASGTFDVKITNIEYDTENSTLPATRNGNYVVSPYDANHNPFGSPAVSATLSASFSEPGQIAVWDVTVTNNGTIDAVMKADIATSSDAESYYEMICMKDDQEGTEIEGVELAANGGSTTFKCYIAFDRASSITSDSELAAIRGQSVNLQVSVSAVQKVYYQAPGANIPTWVVSNNGVLIAYNGKQTNVVVPDTDDNGTPIRYIASRAFQHKNSAGIVDLANNKAYLYPEYANNEYLLGIINQAGMTLITYEELLQGNYVLSESQLNRDITPFMPLNDTDDQFTVTSVDLSNAAHLEAIYPLAFVGRDNDGETHASLLNITFPQNGALTKIGKGAFLTNQLTSITLPSTITNIYDGAFSENALTSVTVNMSQANWNNVTKGSNIFGWANGYSDNNITFVNN